MEFTYYAYSDMLAKLSEKGYQFANYKNWHNSEKTVILRHDVDYSLQKAVELSETEKDIYCGATYFILISTNFYNVHSKSSRECIDMIIKNGGNIGLHFDETQYCIQTEEELKECVSMETDILSGIIGMKVDVVSMHRPSEKFLTSDIEFTDIINSYSKVYFNDMKYLSDSRRHWRENVDEIIEQGNYQRLHILTHPFWYKPYMEWDIKQTLKNAILNASLNFYDNMNNNFRNLTEEIERNEIERIISR